MYICTRYDRGVEKLVSRRAHNPKAAGSSPAPATTKRAGLPAFFIWSCSIMDIMWVSGTQDSGSIPDRTTSPSSLFPVVHHPIFIGFPGISFFDPILLLYDDLTDQLKGIGYIGRPLLCSGNYNGCLK